MLKWLLCLPVSLFGYAETDSLADALKGAERGVLVVLDLDDTLIRYPSHLGSTTWFEEEVLHLEPDTFHKIAGLLANHLQVVPVEEGAVSLIESVQKSGAHVMGITRRTLVHPACPNWPQVTQNQIASIGITFTPPQEEGLYGGILITDGKGKGPSLVSYLASLDTPPTKIVFVDDRKREVSDVEASVSPHCQTECIWYRYLELNGPTYDAHLASEELSTLLQP